MEIAQSCGLEFIKYDRKRKESLASFEALTRSPKSHDATQQPKIHKLQATQSQF